MQLRNARVVLLAGHDVLTSAAATWRRHVALAIVRHDNTGEAAIARVVKAGVGREHDHLARIVAPADHVLTR